jgi:hypothetical protein
MRELFLTPLQEMFIGESDQADTLAAEKKTRLHRSNAPFDEPVSDEGPAYWDHDQDEDEQTRNTHIRDGVITFCRMLKHTKVETRSSHRHML